MEVSWSLCWLCTSWGRMDVIQLVWTNNTWSELRSVWYRWPSLDRLGWVLCCMQIMNFVLWSHHFSCSSRSFKVWMYFLAELQFQSCRYLLTENKIFSDDLLSLFWMIVFLCLECYPVMYAEKYYWDTKGKLILRFLYPWDLQRSVMRNDCVNG